MRPRRRAARAGRTWCGAGLRRLVLAPTDTGEVVVPPGHDFEAPSSALWANSRPALELPSLLLRRLSSSSGLGLQHDFLDDFVSSGEFPACAGRRGPTPPRAKSRRMPAWASSIGDVCGRATSLKSSSSAVRGVGGVPPRFTSIFRLWSELIRRDRESDRLLRSTCLPRPLARGLFWRVVDAASGW